MKEILYNRIIQILDRYRTWLEIASINSVQSHTVVINGRMTGIVNRMLVVRAIHHRLPYLKGQLWQIAEYDLEQAVKTLRTKDKDFRTRVNNGILTPKDVESIIVTATHGIVNPNLSQFPIFTCYSYYGK